MKDNDIFLNSVFSLLILLSVLRIFFPNSPQIFCKDSFSPDFQNKLNQACYIYPLFPASKPNPKLPPKCTVIGTRYSKNNDCSGENSKTSCIWSSNLFSVAISVALIAPLPAQAIPSLNSKSFSIPSTTTPFSQAKNLPTGLENGKIRPCPSINPSCVSSNPKSSNFAFPWRIVGHSSDGATIQQLQNAIGKTQKNVKLQLVEDTTYGQYLQAEVDGGFGRDVFEFLVNGDVVSFRAMATKVSYVYPFTTAFGDSKGQEERLNKIIGELGWDAPSFDAMD